MNDAEKELEKFESILIRDTNVSSEDMKLRERIEVESVPEVNAARQRERELQ